MARDHCRISVDIWDDDDWTELTSVQQLVYFTLISSADLSWCGVLPHLPARYALLSKDMTGAKFERAMKGLEAGRFLIIDRTTAEVLVRSYVRHDGLVKQPNVMKALVKAYDKVHSEHLREAIRIELARLHREQPEARGWNGMAEASPELLAELLTTPSPNPSGNPSANPSTKGKATPLPPSPIGTSRVNRHLPEQTASRHELTIAGGTDAQP